MRIFLCWSGTRSQKVALALEAFLRELNQKLDIPPASQFVPLISANIEKGLPWFQEIEDTLADADAALLAVTPENANSPWMHYEAGAIASRLAHSRAGERKSQSLKGCLYTYFFGMEARELSGPLAAYQATVATYDDTRALVRQLIGIEAKTGPAGESGASQTRWDEGPFRLAWNAMAAKFRECRTQAFGEAVIGLEDKFRRLTFEEPIASCHRQAWTDRIKGCHEVLTDLDDHLDRVKSRCRPYEAELYRQLLGALDGYEMTMHAYLISEEKFKLGMRGKLKMSEGTHLADDYPVRPHRQGIED